MVENATMHPTMAVLPAAGAAVATVVRAGAGADLAGPTPCGDWDLRTLLRHFVGTSGAFVRAGETQALDPEDPWGASAVLDEERWADELAGRVEAMTAAWNRPQAWAGMIQGAQMPAAAVGELGLLEILLHGWDVARAAGRSLPLSDEVGVELLRCLEPTLELGREYEVYAPPVDVPEGAPAFERALGLSGRDPAWTA